MEALKRLTLALTVALMGVACGDDDGGDGPGNGNLDGSVKPPDGGVDGSVSTGTGTYKLPDGGPLPCNAATPAANGKCGGSSCEQTEAQLAASASAGAKCGAAAEVAAFCSLGAVDKVTACSYMFVSNLPAMPDKFESETKTCSTTSIKAADPTFSDECIDCFTKSARCTAEKCLLPCATGTGSTACETCRISTGCIDEFYQCAGYTNPLIGIVRN